LTLCHWSNFCFSGLTNICVFASDVVGWVDESGDTCEDYNEPLWCENYGDGYFGLFGKNANQAWYVTTLPISEYQWCTLFSPMTSELCYFILAVAFVEG